jgi:hypothetical protein
MARSADREFDERRTINPQTANGGSHVPAERAPREFSGFSRRMLLSRDVLTIVHDKIPRNSRVASNDTARIAPTITTMTLSDQATIETAAHPHAGPPYHRGLASSMLFLDRLKLFD